MKQFIGIDKGEPSGDFDCVTKGYIDDNGVLNITSVKLSSK